MGEPRIIPCDACEGTGWHHEHCPSFYDPYYMHQTRRPCLACNGTGDVEIEVEPIEMEDFIQGADEESDPLSAFAYRGGNP